MTPVLDSCSPGTHQTRQPNSSVGEGGGCAPRSSYPKLGQSPHTPSGGESPTIAPSAGTLTVSPSITGGELYQHFPQRKALGWWIVGAGMELVTRLPGGHVIVFVLAILIAVAAFAARRWETRRLAPRPPAATAAAPA